MEADDILIGICAILVMIGFVLVSLEVRQLYTLKRDRYRMESKERGS